MTVCLGVCAIARNETPYLLEWISYQRLIGAQVIFIYDNGHDESGSTLLAELNHRKIITHIPWRGSYAHGPQIPAYNDAITRLRQAVDWLLFVDIDEFLVPVREESLTAILDSAGDLDGMWFPWLLFGSSGDVKYRPLPVIERFTNRQEIDDSTITPVKSAVRPSKVTRAGIHVHSLDSAAYANPMGERRYITTVNGANPGNGYGDRRASQPARGFRHARIHDYMTK